jgi:hypothetical protein
MELVISKSNLLELLVDYIRNHADDYDLEAILSVCTGDISQDDINIGIGNQYASECVIDLDDCIDTTSREDALVQLDDEYTIFSCENIVKYNMRLIVDDEDPMMRWKVTVYDNGVMVSHWFVDARNFETAYREGEMIANSVFPGLDVIIEQEN